MQKSCTKTVKYEGKGTERKCDKPIRGENALSFIKLSILNYRVASKILNANNTLYYSLHLKLQQSQIIVWKLKHLF